MQALQMSGYGRKPSWGEMLIQNYKIKHFTIWLEGICIVSKKDERTNKDWTMPNCSVHFTTFVVSCAPYSSQ